VDYGDQETQRTPNADNIGKLIPWNHSMTIPVYSVQDEFEFGIRDEQEFDMIGQGKISVVNII